MGDESSSPTTAAPPSAAQQQTTQDLLADIFGSSDASSTPAPTSPTAPSSNVNDIMSLFGSTSLSPQPTGYSSPPASTSTPSNDLFSTLASTPAAPAPAPAPAPTPSAPQPHEAYNGNGLKITLTPIRDSNNRSVVNILAKFTSTQPVQSVNFQAAVPKVRCFFSCSCIFLSSLLLYLVFADSKATDACYVKDRRSTGIYGDSTTASDGQRCRREFPLLLDFSYNAKCCCDLHRLSFDCGYESLSLLEVHLSKNKPISLSLPISWHSLLFSLLSLFVIPSCLSLALR